MGECVGIKLVGKADGIKVGIVVGIEVGIAVKVKHDDEPRIEVVPAMQLKQIDAELLEKLPKEHHQS